MSLSYYFTFTAPATATADELTVFLKSVETEAQRMGFRPTVVLNVLFDTAERRRFARRLTTGFFIEDERLKGVALPGGCGGVGTQSARRKLSSAANKGRGAGGHR